MLVASNDLLTTMRLELHKNWYYFGGEMLKYVLRLNKHHCVSRLCVCSCIREWGKPAMVWSFCHAQGSLMNPGLALIHVLPRHDYYQHIKKTGITTNFLQPSVVDWNLMRDKFPILIIHLLCSQSCVYTLHLPPRVGFEVCSHIVLRVTLS